MRERRESEKRGKGERKEEKNIGARSDSRGMTKQLKGCIFLMFNKTCISSSL